MPIEVLPFTQVCRHCKGQESIHVEGHCLFDSTRWEPMNQGDWNMWQRQIWDEIGNLGGEWLRDQIRGIKSAREFTNNSRLTAEALRIKPNAMVQDGKMFPNKR